MQLHTPTDLTWFEERLSFLEEISDVCNYVNAILNRASELNYLLTPMAEQHRPNIIPAVLSNFMDNLQLQALLLINSPTKTNVTENISKFRSWFVRELTQRTLKLMSLLEMPEQIASDPDKMQTVSQLIATGDISSIYAFYSSVLGTTDWGVQTATKFTDLIISVRGMDEGVIAPTFSNNLDETRPSKATIEQENANTTLVDMDIYEEALVMPGEGDVTTTLATKKGPFTKLSVAFQSHLQRLNDIYYNIFAKEWGETGINPTQLLQTLSACTDQDVASFLSANKDNELVPAGASVVLRLNQERVLHEINSLLKDTINSHLSEGQSPATFSAQELQGISPTGEFVYFSEVFIDRTLRDSVGRRPFVELINRPLKEHLANGVSPDTPIIFFTKGKTPGEEMPAIYYFAKLLKMNEISSPSMIEHNRHAYTIPLGYLHFISSYPFPAIPILGYSTAIKKVKKGFRQTSENLRQALTRKHPITHES